MNEEMRQLFIDLGEVEDFREMAEFLRDLLTNNELRMVAQRWHIARALWSEDKPYRNLAEEIRTSVTTIIRVAYRVWYGGGGFQRILEKVLPKRMSEGELEEKEQKEFERRRKTQSRGMVRGSRFAKKHF
jgi:TrpR-related protein YerC/YecD